MHVQVVLKSSVYGAERALSWSVMKDINKLIFPQQIGLKALNSRMSLRSYSEGFETTVR